MLLVNEILGRELQYYNRHMGFINLEGMDFLDQKSIVLTQLGQLKTSTCSSKISKLHFYTNLMATVRELTSEKHARTSRSYKPCMPTSSLACMVET